MDWLILCLIVPAIIVPIVLLWGFAGCDLVFKLEAPPPDPVVLLATPKSITEIELSWVSTGTGLSFEIHRAPDGSSFEKIASVSGSTFVDPTEADTPTPLAPGITFSYQVIAVLGDLKSIGSNIVRARPLAFEFDLLTAPSATNEVGFAGDSIVQKIGVPLLHNFGQVARIHVRGSTDDDLTINSMFISQVAPLGAPGNPNPNPFDSDADIKRVTLGGVFVPANTSVAVDMFSAYAIPDPPQDLLIAFDIADIAGQGRVRRAPLGNATAFTRDNIQEASVADRTPPYATEQNAIYMIERIEVL